jgi:hypothetical protein
MNMNRFVNIKSFAAIVLIAIIVSGCNNLGSEKKGTQVSIRGDKWYFNDIIINQGTPAEGLLMNVRMVNSVFEDRGEELSRHVEVFDPVTNTSNFVSKIPEYVNSGVNAFTISLQGGFPGFEGAVNSAFNSDGTLRDEYLQRVEKVIRTCDAKNAAVILSCFYQRQHSHFAALSDKGSIKIALKNTINWVTEKRFNNVIIEVSNEYRHGGYRNWPDGEWLVSEAGQVELIHLAKQLNPNLIVSTSGMGTGNLHESLIEAADFLLIHFNNTSLNDYGSKITELKKYGKPLVCNEDDKVQRAGAIALAFSVLNKCGWGYMNSAKNQNVPFEFEGADDDSEVYKMFRNATTPGFQFDEEMFNQPFLIVTSPNDGNVFNTGQNIRILVSVVNPPDETYIIKVLANNQEIAEANERHQATWNGQQTGVFFLEAVMQDKNGKELLRSPKTEIIIQ